MASVKKANVPPTHPTVWLGLGLAVIGLLVATYAYTGARVYEIGFAFAALGGAILALAGILMAAWGRSIMAARASRSRRAVFKEDALAMAKPVKVSDTLEEPASEDAPTIAAPREKKRFAFPLPKLGGKGERKPAERAEGAGGGSVFAFKRRAPDPAATPVTVQPEPAAADPEERIEVALETALLETAAEERVAAPEPAAPPVRVTLKCPSCSTTFSAEGVRPFQATCSSCGFSATV